MLRTGDVPFSRRALLSLALALVAAGASLVPGGTAEAAVGDVVCSNGARFRTVFEEQFNGWDVNALKQNWIVFDNQAGHGGFGRREQEALSLQGNRLVITAGMRNGVLQSGGVELSSRFAATYGRYVIKLRADGDPSLATNAVALTWPTSNNLIRDGENNIFETYDDRDDRAPVYSFIHMPGFGNDGLKQEVIRHDGIDGRNWVTSEMEWTPNWMIFTQYDHTTRAWSWKRNRRSEVIPHNPHALHLQLDAFKSSMGADVRMEIDYVSVATYEGTC